MCIRDRLRVTLVLCLMRFFGMESYVGILFFSTIFNASLSLHRLLKVTQVRLSLMGNVALPLACAILSVLVGKALLGGTGIIQPLCASAVGTVFSAAVFAALYTGASRLWQRAWKKPAPARTGQLHDL